MIYRLVIDDVVKGTIELLKTIDVCHDEKGQFSKELAEDSEKLQSIFNNYTETDCEQIGRLTKYNQLVDNDTHLGYSVDLIWALFRDNVTKELYVEFNQIAPAEKLDFHTFFSILCVKTFNLKPFILNPIKAIFE